MQNILFYSKQKPFFYPVIDKHYTWVPIHNEFNFEILSEHWLKYKPLAIYTYGDEIPWQILSSIFRLRKCWVHLDKLPDSIDVVPNVFSNILGHKFDSENPIMSIISTSFNSKHKIMRPFNSLRSQTYTNWEWIIWDDSENDETYKNLLELQKKDLRIRVFKAPYHSGYIGEMKRMAAGMAQGSFIVEVDHDDDLHSNLLKWIHDASKQFPDANFFYTDCAELTEEIYTPATYGEFFAFGYSMHYNEWSKMHNTWLAPAVAPCPNAVTLSHIVGVPNHVRVWKTDHYDKIGKHNPLLSVADDYDILLRSYIEGKWCHIRADGYYQYRNRDGNFTFIRNSLIQHNVKHIYPFYADKLPKRHPQNTQNVQQFKIDEEFYEKTHHEFIPEEKRYEITVALFDPTKEVLEKEIADLLATGKKFCVCVVGQVPDTLNPDYRQYVLWWNLESKDINDRKRYVKKFMHISGEIVFKLENETTAETS